MAWEVVGMMIMLQGEEEEEVIKELVAWEEEEKVMLIVMEWEEKEDEQEL